MSAAVILILSIVGMGIAGSRYVADSEQIVVGRSEQIVLTSQSSDVAVSSAARLDTGADRSSIDRSIIEALGLDLSDAPTVRVRSALGTEVRPIVDIAVEFAGNSRTIEMNVSDRAGQSFPVLLGVDALDGFIVDPSLDDGKAETVAADRATVDAVDRLVADDLPESLLVLLPLAAAIVVGLRMVLGLKPLGTFAPVLLALAITHAGAVFVLLVVAAFAATFAVQPFIVRLRVPRQARLAILIGVVVLMWLVVLGATSNGLSAAQGVPVIVTVVVLDGLWIVLTDDGLADALRTTAHTAVASVVVLAVISAASIRALALEHPYPVTAAGIVLATAAGSYRGLRLSEFIRFRRRRFQHDDVVGGDTSSPVRTAATSELSSDAADASGRSSAANRQPVGIGHGN